MKHDRNIACGNLNINRNKCMNHVVLSRSRTWGRLEVYPSGYFPEGGPIHHFFR